MRIQCERKQCELIRFQCALATFNSYSYSVNTVTECILISSIKEIMPSNIHACTHPYMQCIIYWECFQECMGIISVTISFTTVANLNVENCHCSISYISVQIVLFELAPAHKTLAVQFPYSIRKEKRPRYS